MTSKACHTLPSKKKNTPPALIIHFTNRFQKQAVLKRGRKLKGTDMYINDHLTKENVDIARRAHILKRFKQHGHLNVRFTLSQMDQHQRKQKYISETSVS